MNPRPLTAGTLRCPVCGTPPKDIDHDTEVKAMAPAGEPPWPSPVAEFEGVNYLPWHCHGGHVLLSAYRPPDFVLTRVVRVTHLGKLVVGSDG
jgi:hypothetical protein